MSIADTIGTTGGQYALGSIGSAINAMVDGAATRSMYAQQTRQLAEEIAYQRKIMEQQAELRRQEVARQQMFARGAGSAFADSLAQFTGAEGGIGDKTGAIAQAFLQAMSGPGRSVQTGPTVGPVADREAAARAKASDRAASDAKNLAAVQAFGEYMTDKSNALTNNETVAALLRDFAGGSARASTAEIQAKNGKLYQPRVLAPQPTMLGDLFVGLSNLGAMAARQPAAPASPYALDIPAARPMGLSMTNPLDAPSLDNGVGIRMSMPTGVGLRIGNRRAGD